MELLLDSRALSLSRREADLALRLARLRQRGLVARRLAQVASALYASPRYLAAHGRPAGGEGLLGHAVLAYDDRMAEVPEHRWLATHASRAERVLSVAVGVGRELWYGSEAAPGSTARLAGPLEIPATRAIPRQSGRCRYV